MKINSLVWTHIAAGLCMAESGNLSSPPYRTAVLAHGRYPVPGWVGGGGTVHAHDPAVTSHVFCKDLSCLFGFFFFNATIYSIYKRLNHFLFSCSTPLGRVSYCPYGISICLCCRPIYLKIYHFHYIITFHVSAGMSWTETRGSSFMTSATLW